MEWTGMKQNDAKKYIFTEVENNVEENIFSKSRLIYKNPYKFPEVISTIPIGHELINYTDIKP